MEALWDREDEPQEEGKTDNLQNKGRSVIMLAKNIKANLFRSKNEFMALLKPTGVTKVTVCGGENISSIQTNSISPPVPTLLGCPNREDTHASAVPLASSLPVMLSWQRGHACWVPPSRGQVEACLRSLAASGLLQGNLDSPLRWDVKHVSQGSADIGKSYTRFNSSYPTFSRSKLSQLTRHTAPFLLHKISHNAQFSH